MNPHTLKNSFGSADFQQIFDFIAAFNEQHDCFELLEIILVKMMEMVNADAGTLYIAENQKLHFRIVKNTTLNIFQNEDIDLPPICLDSDNIENVSAYAAIKNEVVCIDDVYTSTEFNFSGPKNYDKITGYKTTSMLVFPLVATSERAAVSEPVIGVIQLINAIDKETGEVCSFREVYDPYILKAISNIAANTLANVLYTKEIEEIFNSFVKVMIAAIEERSRYNSNHTNNVAKYCDEFVSWLSRKFPKGHMYHFNKNRHDQIIMSSLLHDIGKIAIPLEIMDKSSRLSSQLDSVLFKFEIKRNQLEISRLKNEISEQEYKVLLNEFEESLNLVKTVNTAGFITEETAEKIQNLAKLTYIDGDGNTVSLLTELNLDALSVRRGTITDTEREIMEEHAVITGKLLSNMKFNTYYRDVTDWAKAHHERLDGTGYPEGLQGESVTVEMRILAILDIYDALVAIDRPYKKSLSAEEANEILSEMARKGQLDKELVELFIESMYSIY